MSHSKNVPTRALRSVLALSALVSLAAASAIAQNASAYVTLAASEEEQSICRMVNIGHLPGATLSLANGINSRGQIVGTSGSNAFLYSEFQMKNLGTLGGATSYAYGINRSGQVVGHADTKSGTTHAFLYEKGKMADIGTLGGSNSFAYGINDAGQIVGQAQTTSGTYHAFVYQHGGMTDLGSFAGGNSTAYRINNNGIIVGSSYINATDFHAFSYQNGVMKDLGNGPGYTDSEAFGINDKGDIVGYTETADASQVRGFIYKNGQLTNLPSLGGNSSYAADINKRGVTAGYSQIGDGSFHSVAYVPKITFDLGTLPQGVFSFALAVNNHNDIVGYSGTKRGTADAYVCKFTGGHDDNEDNDGE